MSRKDTIIITVLINLGLLAILFAVAVIYDDDATLEHPAEIKKSLVLAPASVPAPTPIPVDETAYASSDLPADEVDHVLNSYVNADGQEVSVFEEVVQEPPAHAKEEGETTASAPSETGDFVEVTIKRGDALEKIARANNTTIDAIKKENNLRSEKLSVGQVLRVPVGKKKRASQVSENARASTTTDKQYYIVKSGDSPWKIAKQFNVKFEDLLKLNNLDEEKARNLKVGDKIRVK